MKKTTVVRAGLSGAVAGLFVAAALVSPLVALATDEAPEKAAGDKKVEVIKAADREVGTVKW
ncbi:hypothetical protein E1263_26620 [Kribbella antibiotica]|uniref:Uncharacterized protein n=2 Tax=Kribbella antibiotica TaxID=190195 RepID=A0A4R4Z9E9_9ACTN|nr:hypothetical protein E1263_26620 [Kribbella antibiotica]